MQKVTTPVVVMSVMLAVPAYALVICTGRSGTGAMRVRATCRTNEVQVDPVALGLQGPPGPPGASGLVGTEGDIVSFSGSCVGTNQGGSGQTILFTVPPDKQLLVTDVDGTSPLSLVEITSGTVTTTKFTATIVAGLSRSFASGIPWPSNSVLAVTCGAFTVTSFTVSGRLMPRP